VKPLLEQGDRKNESVWPNRIGEIQNPYPKGDPYRTELYRIGENSPLKFKEKGFALWLMKKPKPFLRGGEMTTDENLTPRPEAKRQRTLTPRQQLRLKRKKLRGRVNALRDELSQVEPLLARVEEQLRQSPEQK
jgi:hypothetical protein